MIARAIKKERTLTQKALETILMDLQQAPISLPAREQMREWRILAEL